MDVQPTISRAVADFQPTTSRGTLLFDLQRANVHHPEYVEAVVTPKSARRRQSTYSNASSLASSVASNILLSRRY